MEKVRNPALLRDFQAEWESPAVGLFREAAFSTALSPTDTATQPEKASLSHSPAQYGFSPVRGSGAGKIWDLRQERLPYNTENADLDVAASAETLMPSFPAC